MRVSLAMDFQAMVLQVITIEPTNVGTGKILQINGLGDNQRISVAFEENGTKHLLIKFAKLTLV